MPSEPTISVQQIGQRYKVVGLTARPHTLVVILNRGGALQCITPIAPPIRAAAIDAVRRYREVRA